MLRANGGRIETVFNDMLALDHFFGVTDIVILHHTGFRAPNTYI